MNVRETVAQFIQSEGHRVESAPVEPADGVSELLFRTRGQVFAITTYENDPGVFTISTAYEIPDWARERGHNAETLRDAEREYPDMRFVLAQEGGLFVVSSDESSGSVQAFTGQFWDLVGGVREAGTWCIERIVDRTESKVAAEKFISEFMREER